MDPTMRGDTISYLCILYSSSINKKKKKKNQVYIENRITLINIYNKQFGRL